MGEAREHANVTPGRGGSQQGWKQETPGRCAVVRDGQVTGRHAVRRERRGWTGETILNRLTGVGGC